MSIIIDTVSDLQSMFLREQHCELVVLPCIAQLTKTDIAKAFGLPSEFPSGKLKQDGDPEMIRAQDVINAGAWRKHLLRPQPRNLPPGFTIVHFSLTQVATDFTRFFIEYYSKRYKKLPLDSKWTLFNQTRACAIWESFSEKRILQERGLKAFACPEVYELYVQSQELYKSYQSMPRKINKATFEMRNFGTELSKARGKAVANFMRQESYDRLKSEVTVLLDSAPPLPLLPPGIPEFKLLEEPPTEFTEGA